MAKKLSTYKPVMGVVYNDTPVTDLDTVLKLIKGGRTSDIISWPGGNALFYLDQSTGDVVYLHDIDFTYLVDDSPVTPLDLIKLARHKGFRGNDTNTAAEYMTERGHRVKLNPNPSKKFIVPENH